MEGMFCKHCHRIEVDEVRRVLGTDPRHGLSTFEVKQRQERFGPNTVTVKKKKGPLVRLLLQFHNPLIYILLVAAAITAILREWVDSGVIFGVVLVNAIIGFIQESKAEEAIESLKKMVTTEATLLREGKKVRIPSQEIVPGDVVILNAGDKVPSDIRLFDERDLQIDESTLTGESLPVHKDCGILPEEVPLADRKNMAYAGTLVTYGQGWGYTVSTGDATETGRIAYLVSETESLQTPLTRKISKFSKYLLFIILGLAAVTFFVGFIRHGSIVEMFMAAVALSVGAIPEGLPAAMTITLAIGVSRMARRRAIIRKLPAVETLGSTTVICSDKTGTLTENQMTVQKIMAGQKIYELTGQGYKPEGNILYEDKTANIKPGSPLYECIVAGYLCNDSHLVKKDEIYTVQGDPTESALIVSAYKSGLNLEEIESGLPRLDTIPFASEIQYMATLHDTGPQRPQPIYVKGSTESILKRADKLLLENGETASLEKEQIIKIADDLAFQGLRVLAFAKGDFQADKKTINENDVSSGLTFLGLQAMIDPPRKEAIRAVSACQGAGIKIKMITGDHALTAANIAMQLGIKDPKVLTGQELSSISDEDLIAKVEEVPVYARVAPEQKLKLVYALQARGHVAAMTGDGVNDAPALKQADIGVAMGMAGTDVAKEASDMVLTDDNFASIEAAVEEGRGVFDNLTKFIVWTLPTNLGEGLVILAAIFLGVTLPILPVQILWINMTTAVCLGLMLAFEPKEPGIMQRLPRNPKSPIVTAPLLWRIGIVGFLLLSAAFGLFELEQARYGARIDEARTVAVNVFVFLELFYLFNCRSLTKSAFKLGFLSNRWIAGGITIMICLQLLYTYVPIFNRFFHSAPISLNSWIRIISCGVILWFIVGSEKFIRARIEKRRS